MFGTQRNDGVEHFRWPFCRTYPTNPNFNGPPQYFTYIDPITKEASQKEVYVSAYTLDTWAQMEADKKWGNILKCIGGLAVAAGLITLGLYLGTTD